MASVFGEVSHEVTEALPLGITPATDLSTVPKLGGSVEALEIQQ